MAAFKPAKAQRWDIYAGFADATSSKQARTELRGWCGLALAALAIAGFFALLVALSRVPGFGQLAPLPVAFFSKGMVVHVIFSFVVWFLSVFGALATVAAYRMCGGQPKGWGLNMAAVGLGYVASVMLLLPALMDRGEPSLNNYIPMILDPLYYAGLAVLAVSLCLVVVRLFVAVAGRDAPLEPLALGAVNGGLLFLAALACVGIAGYLLVGAPVDGAYFENLFWGGGHVLQFMNVALLITAWYLLGGLALETPFVRPNQQGVAHVLLIGAALVAPLFFVLFDPFDSDQISAFTMLQYAFVPPTLLVALLGCKTVLAATRTWTDVRFLCLVMSIAVFGLGGVLGIFVDGADTRTPAHYHGVIGGINLAFMGLFFGFFLPLMGRNLRSGRAHLMSVWFYATGQTLHSLGLFLAGGYGAPRKTAAYDQTIEALGAQIGLYGMGIGAVIAVVGGVMFICISGVALLRRVDP